MNLFAIATAALLISACSASQERRGFASQPLSNLASAGCLAEAAAAADQQYGKSYKADWYVKLRAVVQAGRIGSVEVKVGPFDGSAGGGIVARYDCSERRLVTLELER